MEFLSSTYVTAVRLLGRVVVVMRNLLTIIAVLSVLSPCVPARAQEPMTAQSFYQDYCLGAPGSLNSATGFCMGYVAGMGEIGCVPTGTSYEEEVRAFVNWAASHPEQLNQDMAHAVYDALWAVWPCPKDFNLPAKLGHLTMRAFYQDYCLQHNNTFGNAFCMGYVNGIGEIGEIACPPPTASFRAETQVFLKWAASHPEDGGMNEDLAVLTALRASWPCPTPKVP